MLKLPFSRVHIEKRVRMSPGFKLVSATVPEISTASPVQAGQYGMPTNRASGLGVGAKRVSNRGLCLLRLAPASIVSHLASMTIQVLP
jgi:hypothetical protein